uniref:probable bifunctional dTTP/UTP pyrophosphatase/methyltransferase protein n=1 Tax=Myodes glareolus TaxID=447135 RepID=UPI0020206DA2|nr:probable bifunctional dTTP/UTP pyrophosphatase/methyltransferase protein [Myodes glareolus]XP_048297630.1 probable bifunctional dTTP/UTP pyrophosphatase/methyltransferase protein [Myodes glareolus]
MGAATSDPEASSSKWKFPDGGRHVFQLSSPVRQCPNGGRHVFPTVSVPMAVSEGGNCTETSHPEAPATHLKCPRGPAMALTPVLRRLRGLRVVLASASPRRRDILSYTGLRFEVVPSRFSETLDKATFPTPHDYAQETARQKALEVAQRLREKDQRTPDIVIGADTVVAMAGLILEKPQDKEDAFRMLRRLSGQEHSVITGVAIVRFPRCNPGAQPPDPEVTSFHEETRVTFSVLTDELLRDYVDSGEPMDKAGGYALQALGAMLVEHAEGDFLGAVGFPLNRFCRELQAVLGPEVTPPLCGGADHGDGPRPLPATENPGIDL